MYLGADPGLLSGTHRFFRQSSFLSEAVVSCVALKPGEIIFPIVGTPSGVSGGGAGWVTQ